MMGMTARQRRLLVAVVASSRAGKCEASLSTLALRVGLSPSSKGHIHDTLHYLRERGYMIRTGLGCWHPTSAAYTATMPRGVVRGPDVQIGGERHLSLLFNGGDDERQ
jgi:hypothetical protein